MKFDELKLSPVLLDAIEKQEWTDCMPVQEEVIPYAIEGRDVAGLAQTGTGKTAAFLLPMMERIIRARDIAQREREMSPEELKLAKKRAFRGWRRGHYILVLVPTRELAQQVYDETMTLGAGSSLGAVVIYGGTAYEQQKQGLRDGVEFVIGTPGRLIDLYKSRALDLSGVRAVVFDEADRMFDMGFKQDMTYMLRKIDKRRQFLVFSATLNFDVMRTAYRFGADPVEFNLSQDEAKAENVVDRILHLGTDEKAPTLLGLLRKQDPKQTIIFSNFKAQVERIASFLQSNGYPAAGISSQLSQGQRTKVLSRFRGENNEHNILVATDVAARGLDIVGVDLVINYELPEDPENYVHRIGRTGRAGAEGTAYSLVSDLDVDSLVRIEKFLKHKVEVVWLEDDELPKEYRPFPRREPRRQRGRRDGGPRGRGDRRGGGAPRSGSGGRGGGKAPRDSNRSRGRGSRSKSSDPRQKTS